MTSYKVVEALVTYLVYDVATDEEAMSLVSDTIIDTHKESLLEVELASVNVVAEKMQEEDDPFTY